MARWRGRLSWVLLVGLVGGVAAGERVPVASGPGSVVAARGTPDRVGVARDGRTVWTRAGEVEDPSLPAVRGPRVRFTDPAAAERNGARLEVRFTPDAGPSPPGEIDSFRLSQLLRAVMARRRARVVRPRAPSGLRVTSPPREAGEVEARKGPVRLGGLTPRRARQEVPEAPREGVLDVRWEPGVLPPEALPLPVTLRGR